MTDLEFIETLTRIETLSDKALCAFIKFTSNIPLKKFAGEVLYSRSKVDFFGEPVFGIAPPSTYESSTGSYAEEEFYESPF